MERNATGTTHNLDRARIRKLLIIGLVGAVMTGVGDFLLGFGDSLPASGLAESMLASAPNLSDAQLVAGGLLGVIGLFLEAAGFFAIFRLIADSSPRAAHIYRAGIIGYLWLAPIGCHMNVAVMNLAYKHLLASDPGSAASAARIMIYAFYIPIWCLLLVAWVPMIVIQWRCFATKRTPYPRYAQWFNLIIGMVLPLIVGAIVGLDRAWGAGIAMTFLSCGNAFCFLGLLACLPSQEQFALFESGLRL